MIIEQADRLRNLVDRLLGRSCPVRALPKVFTKWLNACDAGVDGTAEQRAVDSGLRPSLPELAHDPDQIEQVLLNIVAMRYRRWGRRVVKSFCVPARVSTDLTRRALSAGGAD